MHKDVHIYFINIKQNLYEGLVMLLAMKASINISFSHLLLFITMISQTAIFSFCLTRPFYFLDLREAFWIIIHGIDKKQGIFKGTVKPC